MQADREIMPDAFVGARDRLESHSMDRADDRTDRPHSERLSALDAIPMLRHRERDE